MARRAIILLIALAGLAGCHEPTVESVWREPDLTQWRAEREAMRQEREARGYVRPAAPPLPGPMAPGETDVSTLGPMRQSDGWDYAEVRPPLRPREDLGPQPRQWQSIDRRYHRMGMHFDPYRGTVDATHPWDTRLRAPSHYERLERLNEPPSAYQRRSEMLNVPPDERRPAEIDARIEHRVRESRP